MSRLTFLVTMIIITFAGVILASEVKSQDLKEVRLSVNKKDALLKDIFAELKLKSGFNFVFTEEIGNISGVNLSAKNITLYDVLKIIANQKRLRFNQSNHLIAVTREPAPLKRPPTGAISGRITEFETAQALPGASVSLGELHKGVISDSSGYYRLTNVPAGRYTLEVSFIGYNTEKTTVEIKAGEEVSYDIKLQGGNKLNEVIVVGYGTTKKETLTGAVSTLDMKSKENTPVTNASQALHGVSGLWVNQAGGKPGQDVATIRIRGVGTLNNNDPLILVDGIEYDLNEINPDFIESITVLKDASAAIYGSRAANGVVLVTTKTGKKGKAQVNYNFSYGLQKATYLPDVVWDPIQYMQMKDQALINEGKSPAAVDYTPAQIEEYQAGMATDPITYPNINWFNRVMKTGTLQQHNLRFSGGSDKLVYNIGLGYMNQDGILINANHANRYTLNVSLAADVSSKLHIGTDFIGNYRTYTEPAFGAPDATGYYFTRLMRALPIFTAVLPDGRYGSSVFTTPGRNTVENPLMLLNEGSNFHAPQRILSKIYADYKLPFNLKYNMNLAVDKLDGYARSFIPYVVTYNPKTLAPNNYNVNPAANNYDDNNLNVSLYHTLSWARQIAKKHHISAMAGMSYNSFVTRSFSAHAEGYFDNTLTALNAGALSQSVSGTSTKDRLLSYFGRVNYNYDEKYLLEGTFRYDGSSRFADGKRWGGFPSASAGWRIDKESFFSEVREIDLLKLRMSWGKLGNQAVPLYSYLNTVNLGSSYSFNNVLAPGAAVNSYNDPGISWETTTAYNGGIDADLFNGKLGVSLDVYKKRTSGILRPVNIPQQVGGLAGPVENVGTVDNSGYELSLSHRNKFGDFNIEIAGSVNYNKNNVVDLRGQSIISARRIVQAGSPIDSYYIYQAEGIYQTQDEIDHSAHISSAVKPGYIKYKDINGDGKIDGNDRIITGTSIPKYTYSFNFNAGYKGLTLTAFFQGVQGINLYPTANLASPFNNGAGVTKEWATGAWTPSHTDARLPILTTATGATENYQPSTFWLKDGSYLRLKDLQLKYDLPKKWVSKIRMSKISVFVNGQNLLTFSPYKDFDPEKNIEGDTLYEYPTLKTYSFGLNATF